MANKFKKIALFEFDSHQTRLKSRKLSKQGLLPETFHHSILQHVLFIASLRTKKCVNIDVGINETAHFLMKAL